MIDRASRVPVRWKCRIIERYSGIKRAVPDYFPLSTVVQALRLMLLNAFPPRAGYEINDAPVVSRVQRERRVIDNDISKSIKLARVVASSSRQIKS